MKYIESKEKHLLEDDDENSRRKKKSIAGGNERWFNCFLPGTKDDPIYTEDMVVKMAEAAKWAGAVGIRANSPEQIKAIKEKVDLPIIGLWKIWYEDSDVFITPTLDAAKAVWEAGAEIIALDCTAQITHEKTVAWDLLDQVKKEIPEAIILRMFLIMKRQNMQWNMVLILLHRHYMAIQKKQRILKEPIIVCLRKYAEILKRMHIS